MDYELKGKVAFVTGGSYGLGRGLCENLASEGADIVVNFRSSPEKAHDLVAHLESSYGVKAVAVKGDISSEEDVLRIFDEITKHFGRLDILVNNAGVCPQSPIREMSLEMWRRTMNVNLDGIFMTSRAMVNWLCSQKQPGRIINITSQAAFNGSATGKSAYASSKGGVTSFTISLAKEVAEFGINVNAVAPGMMLTDMTREILEKDADRYAASIPLKRVADVDEVARVVSFLASRGGDYITGTTVHVSGGLCMR
jgi:3-oxoacyl-[acyl-carrier protein] reductase